MAERPKSWSPRERPRTGTFVHGPITAEAQYMGHASGSDMYKVRITGPRGAEIKLEMPVPYMDTEKGMGPLSAITGALFDLDAVFLVRGDAGKYADYLTARYGGGPEDASFLAAVITGKSGPFRKFRRDVADASTAALDAEYEERKRRFPGWAKRVEERERRGPRNPF